MVPAPLRPRRQPRQHRARRRARASRRCASACAPTRSDLAEPRDLARPPRRDRRTTPSAASRARARSPLNDRGREQARELAEARRGAGLRRRCGASPLPRARETAEIVAAAHRPGDPSTSRALMETDTGDWTDRTFAEVEAERPRALRRAGVAGDPDFALPGRRVVRASSRSASSRRSRTSAPPGRCRRSSSATAAPSAWRSSATAAAAGVSLDEVPNGVAGGAVTTRRRARSSRCSSPRRSGRSSSPSGSSTRRRCSSTSRGERVFSPTATAAGTAARSRFRLKKPTT